MPHLTWTPEPGLPQPGEASDQTVADAHGVRRRTVWTYRQRHSIPAGGKSGRPPGGGWEPDPSKLQPGEATDRKVAADQGVAASTVRRWRARNHTGETLICIPVEVKP